MRRKGRIVPRDRHEAARCRGLEKPDRLFSAGFPLPGQWPWQPGQLLGEAGEIDATALIARQRGASVLRGVRQQGLAQTGARQKERQNDRCDEVGAPCHVHSVGARSLPGRNVSAAACPPPRSGRRLYLQPAAIGRYIRSGASFGSCVLVRIDALGTMKAFLTLALLLALTPAAIADERDDATAQVEFGIAVARAGLWEEAEYRWKRATDIDPSYAAAWNNLGIAYEQKGEFDEALDAYERALDLEPDNINIQQNYDLFREIHDRILEGDR
ncbi:MAG: tetratricopeptide repeat protein [Acidobacteria bacterium]|nr:tetratricopeptide repeat protein [Acidobacteriota bacterium]